MQHCLNQLRSTIMQEILRCKMSCTIRSRTGFLPEESRWCASTPTRRGRSRPSARTRCRPRGRRGCWPSPRHLRSSMRRPPHCIDAGVCARMCTSVASLSCTQGWLLAMRPFCVKHSCAHAMLTLSSVCRITHLHVQCSGHGRRLRAWIAARRSLASAARPQRQQSSWASQTCTPQSSQEWTVSLTRSWKRWMRPLRHPQRNCRGMASLCTNLQDGSAVSYIWPVRLQARWGAEV